MNYFEELSKLVAEAETANTIEFVPMLKSKSFGVRNVPKLLAQKFEKAVLDCVKKEGLQAQRRLTERGYRVAKPVYSLTTHKNTMDSTHINFIFKIDYIGPQLERQIVGVYNRLDELLIWFNKQLELIIRSGIGVSDGKSEKPTMMTVQSHYATIIGKFFNYSMDIQIIPSRNEYLTTIQRNMPPAIGNIDMQFVQQAPTALYYRINAAGKSYLEAIGAQITRIMQLEGDRRRNPNYAA